MPQPLRVTIGFNKEAHDRFRELVEDVFPGESQRTIISALLALPDGVIERAILEHKKRELARKEAQKEARALLKKGLRDLTPEKLAEIQRIIGNDGED